MVQHTTRAESSQFSCDGVQSRGPWTGRDRQRHINELELLAAYNAVKSLTAGSSNLTIKLFLDNSTAVCYVNKRGGTKSRALCEILKLIVDWCENRNISISASHLPGLMNYVADEQSRSALDTSDWSLNKSAFQDLAQIWNTDIDLFAAAWNAQHPKFVSWTLQPDAFAQNAFSLRWNLFRGYAFPPFSLIARCLAKVEKERAELVMICPLWPSQPWYPLLLKMANDVPRVFRFRPDILLSYDGQPHLLTNNNSLILSAWRLSGNDSSSKAFRNRWWNYSWRAPETPRQLLTNQLGHHGVIGTLNGIQIPCLLI
jgi:hypothetical protein